MPAECKIAAHSIAPNGAELITYIATYARPIHSEIMTHKMLSKSSASSRAIPTPKLIQRVVDDPWIPQYFEKNQGGMQGGELGESSRKEAELQWLDARDKAVAHAKKLHELGIHKGTVNRLIEPWMFITVIMSGTEWDNYFGLRDHDMAEPHFHYLAHSQRVARAESTPRKLKEGEWHLPLISPEELDVVLNAGNSCGCDGAVDDGCWKCTPEKHPRPAGTTMEELVKISVGRCARVSYLNHEGKRDLKADIDLHDRLMVQRPLHAAPAEHVAQAMDWPDWCKDLMKERVLFQDVRTPADMRTLYLDLKKRARTDSSLARDRNAAAAAYMEMQSGNYLGFTQYRKTLNFEHIGGPMP